MHWKIKTSHQWSYFNELNHSSATSWTLWRPTNPSRKERKGQSVIITSSIDCTSIPQNYIYIGLLLYKKSFILPTVAIGSTLENCSARQKCPWVSHSIFYTKIPFTSTRRYIKTRMVFCKHPPPKWWPGLTLCTVFLEHLGKQTRRYCVPKPCPRCAPV